MGGLKSHDRIRPNRPTRHRWGVLASLAGVIILAGMGLLLIGSAVWHEIQVLRGKR